MDENHPNPESSLISIFNNFRGLILLLHLVPEFVHVTVHLRRMGRGGGAAAALPVHPAQGLAGSAVESQVY